MFTENARSEFVHYDEEVDAPSGPKYDMINKTAARCAALMMQRSNIHLERFCIEGQSLLQHQRNHHAGHGRRLSRL